MENVHFYFPLFEHFYIDIYSIHQTELVRMLQFQNINITRESLVKIERGIQHITASQLRGIRDCLNTTYDELLEPDE